MKRLFIGILPVVSLVVTGITVVPTVALASSSICDAVAGNLVLNCGFEGGTQAPSYPTVPNNWTANADYLAHTTYNTVVGSPVSNVNSGKFALQISNDDPSSGQGTPTLSQTFADTSGQTYNVSYYLQGVVSSDANAFFNAQINGTTLSSFTGASAPGPYTKENFTFTGTGSDTLTFAADYSCCYWYLDDVVVTSAVPLPAAAWLLLPGLGGLGILLRRRRSESSAIRIVAA